MDQHMCLELNGIHAGARTRVRHGVPSSIAFTAPWFPTTTYGDQRPSGAPPG